jgi:AcrR family transcriptional regulator
VAPELGRRERKKAQTRKALADAALDLFLARGYDQVGVREVADAADVSVTTLFKYFPSKESLVFDLDEEIEATLVATVRDRAPGTPLLDALHTFVRERAVSIAAYPLTLAFERLIEQTPTLRAYAGTMWLRHEVALAKAIAADIGAPEDDVTCTMLARVALGAVDLARARPDPGQAVDEIFALLERGWPGSCPSES